MDVFTKGFWITALFLTAISLIKDRKKTLEAAQKSRGMMGSMLGDIVGIIFLIGLILTLIPPQTIQQVLGKANLGTATVAAALVGSITLIPAFVAFPLVGSLVDVGASIVPGVAFLTTLTMVGAVTFPLERKEFGTRFALTRNLFSFGFAVLIALAMGVLMG